MANVNLSRLEGRHKKRDICVFFAEIEYSDILVAADVYQLGMIPPESIVIAATVLPSVTNNAGTSATFDLGFAGGAQLLDNADLKTAAGTDIPSTLAPVHLPTGGILTIVPTYGGAAPTLGKMFVYVEYIEYTQCTGELTNFVA